MVGKETKTSLEIAGVTGRNQNDVMHWLLNQSTSMNNTLEEELREDSFVLLQVNLLMPTRMEH